MDTNEDVGGARSHIDVLEVMMSVAKLGRIRRDIDMMREDERLSRAILDRIALIDGTFAEIQDHLREVLMETS